MPKARPNFPWHKRQAAVLREILNEATLGPLELGTDADHRINLGQQFIGACRPIMLR